MRIARLYACLVLSLFAATATGNVSVAEPLGPLAFHTSTTRSIVEALARRHYVTSDLNDDLSERVFDAYLDNLDASKSYLLKSDVEMFEIYRFRLDDALRKGELATAFEMWNKLNERRAARFETIVEALENGTGNLDYTRSEELLLDREDSPWAASIDELDEWWRKRIKHASLNLKLAGKEPEKIQELLIKRYTTRLNLMRQTRSEDVYQLFMNSFTATYDPHTQYYSPRNTENFNITMSLSLEGIGAVLGQEDEFTKVLSLVPAGPADKSELLKPNDKIVGVGQGEDGEIVNVVGWRLTDVVQLIRGKKNTKVKLDVLPETSDSGQSKVILITRNTVKLEEQSAKANVLELEQYGQPHKIGVIDIPTFYSDFRALQAGDKNYKSTTRDVKQLLGELKAEGVEGVIIDLRNNGGGALSEAERLTGLFIDRGPVVQVRFKNDAVKISNDLDAGIAYGGPLAVLVNRMSASASEIFAGAIQDYGRGIIIGSQTFGKGTVQTILPLPLNRGQLKLTQMKFYRISGDSNQHRGIIPDISYPGSVDPETYGESALDDPLPWDRVKPATYRVRASVAPLVPDLLALHAQRVTEDPEFTYVTEAYNYTLEHSNDKTVSLNEQERLDEKSSSETFWLALENRKRLAQDLEPVASLEDLDGATTPMLAQTISPVGVPMVTAGEDEKGDSETTGSEVAGVTGMIVEDSLEVPVEDEVPESADAFLAETGNILLDLISLQRPTTANKQLHSSRR